MAKAQSQKLPPGVKLLHTLEGHKSGVYGLHPSNRAQVTCLVFERMGHQVHFIDGADGGYALAAKDLKKRVRGKRG